MFRNKLFVFITAAILTFLCMSCHVWASPNWDIYTDTDIYDGQYNLINIYDTPPNSTTVNMYGGSADYITTYNQSTLNFFDGHADVGAGDYSTINISGGTRNAAEAYNYATVNFFGTATATYINAYDFGTVNMTGGTVDGVGVTYSGIANVYGGNVRDRLWAYDSGVINIYGSDLVKTNSGGTYGYGQVHGYLADDTYISVDLSNSDAYPHINIITVVSAEIEIRPKIINMRSKGRWLSCNISLPTDYDVADVNSSSILLQGTVQPDWVWFNQKRNVVMAKFPQSEIAEISQPGLVELTVTGYIGDTTYFIGTDNIKVIDKGHKD